MRRSDTPTSSQHKWIITTAKGFVRQWQRRNVLQHRTKESKKELVQDITDVKHDDQAEQKSGSRPTFDVSSIPPLKSLIGNKPPSPTVKFSLLNVIYAYVYAIKLFGGFEPDNSIEFVSVCLDVSANLRDGQNFDSADMAVESAASAANQVPIM